MEREEEKGSRIDKMPIGTSLKMSVWEKLLNVIYNHGCGSLNGQNDFHLNVTISLFTFYSKCI